MCAFDPSSGNVSNKKTIGRSAAAEHRALVRIQVVTRTEQGLLLPERMQLPDGKALSVSRVYGCRYDGMRQNMLRYGVRIGGISAAMWMRDDRIWFIESKLADRLLQQP
ncbi:hypothetical protein RWV98_09790 [Agathobaculum sp. NTUH-O15-33]|uniref:hypothetical protein n=1 Tax=Agathobaculum sp. NTUH-O15-33 TaxID=3079302 RepID=UPI0029587835|nr:hypothetical protein [Agathobaculum sp. NTUH-O15-33]WNX86532.1 hypothetical protein RWV98_09790 [Agathobaculum sp. NTUH-O15-33]